MDAWDKITETLHGLRTTSDDRGLWYRILRNDPCPYCGRWMMVPLAAGVSPCHATKEHVVPKKEGGEGGVGNVVIVCAACNGAKGDMSLLEFLASPKFVERPNIFDRPESLRLARRVVSEAFDCFGEAVVREGRRGRKLRQLIAWVSVRFGVHPVLVGQALNRPESGKNILGMAQAWEDRRGTGWHWGELSELQLLRRFVSEGATMKERRECGFEARERSPGYWDDPRWKEVRRLREENKQSEANHLTFQIRESWGVE